MTLTLRDADLTASDLMAFPSISIFDVGIVGGNEWLVTKDIHGDEAYNNLVRIIRGMSFKTVANRNGREDLVWSADG